MQFDQFREQLNLPPPFIDISNLLGGTIKVIREKLVLFFCIGIEIFNLDFRRFIRNRK